MRFRPAGFSIIAILCVSLLQGQEPDTTGATEQERVDSLVCRPAFRPLMLVAPLPDTPQPFRVQLVWDEWGHSNQTATLANPFVTSDLKIGAARLDGSLGQPVLSQVIPSASTELNPAPGHWPTDRSWPGISASPDEVTFMPMLMGNPLRSSQTYFYWDQGDYDYRDLQVGGSTEIDPDRNLLLAGHTRAHRGRTNLSGPSRSQPGGNVLQNYLLDYRRRFGPVLQLTYTVLYQRERTGLPLLAEYRADRRRSETWSHGLELTARQARWSGQATVSGTSSEIRTSTDDTPGYHLNRRSLSRWAGAALQYRWTQVLTVQAGWQLKQRSLLDWNLGTQDLLTSRGQAGLANHRKATTWYGGLALVGTRPVLEAAFTRQGAHSTLSVGTEAMDFLDYATRERRLTGDETPWVEGPVGLRRTAMAGRAWNSAGTGEARLALLTTSDGRSAATGGVTMDWVPIPEVLQFQGSFSGVLSSDTLIFPTRINGYLGTRFTVPLQRRAKPFVGAAVATGYNEFAGWLDPRYANPDFYTSTGTVSTTAWVTVEFGLVVADFELRYSMYNLTGATIQNSPYYRSTGRLNHYSLAWRFRPQTKPGQGSGGE